MSDNAIFYRVATDTNLEVSSDDVKAQIQKLGRLIEKVQRRKTSYQRLLKQEYTINDKERDLIDKGMTLLGLKKPRKTEMY